MFVVVFDNCDCQNPSEVSTHIAALAIGKPYPEAVAKIKLDDTYAKSLTGVFDFENEVSRIVYQEEGQLYSQGAGGTKFKIFPIDKVNFIFENDFATYQFICDKTGVKEVIFKSRIDVEKGIKTNKPIPTHIEVAVTSEVMHQYVGVYEIQPGFSIAITLEDNHLMSQATGQGKFEIFPESPTKYFLKVVDAQIEFIKSSEGKYDSFVLYQGGQKIAGKRKN